ncbi:MAG: hypothetical protein PHV85_00575 [Desulfovibrionaceae bacterium]|nr:hypothetical protein [Desulfovibrionaceae bacterium]
MIKNRHKEAGPGPRRLAVVILHYGRAELTARLRDQILETDPDWSDQVLVLDNHAPQPFDRAWKRLGQNLFWAGALEYALAALGQEGFSHVWFLNNDLIFASAPPHLGRAWARLARLEAALGPVGLYSPSALRNPYHPQMVQDPAMQYRTATLVDGIAPLLSLACVRDLGGLDLRGNPYGYGVDLFLALSASRAGWPVVVDHQVAVRHTYHSTARTVDGFMELAAAAEAAYLEKRLGPDYAALIEALKTDFADHPEIQPRAQAADSRASRTKART